MKQKVKKLLFLDLDDTLCKVGQPILQSTLDLLQQLQQQWTLVLTSGKPTVYLSGILRQTGLKNVMIVGENGMQTVSDHHFPPQKEWDSILYKQEMKQIQNLKEKLKFTEFYKGLWFQPNKFMMGIFFDCEDTKNQLVAYLEKNKRKISHLEMSVHVDAVDLVPKGVNKGNSVNQLCHEFDVVKHNTVAIGNGSNDVSMFEQVGVSIGVNYAGEYTPNILFSDIDEALNYVLSLK